MRSKDIGTACESAVVRFLRSTDVFPFAERRALSGAVDLGDITGTPGITWQVKGGKSAEAASDTQVRLWMAETATQARQDGTAVGVLITKRKAVGAGRAGHWWAHLDTWTLGNLMLGSEAPFLTSESGIPRTSVRMLLKDLVPILSRAGYGSTLVS